MNEPRSFTAVIQPADPDEARDRCTRLIREALNVATQEIESAILLAVLEETDVKFDSCVSVYRAINTATKELDALLGGYG